MRGQVLVEVIVQSRNTQRISEVFNSQWSPAKISRGAGDLMFSELVVIG